MPRRLLYIIGALVIMTVAVQAVLIKQLFTRTDKLQTQEIKTVIVDAVRSLNNELVIDPQTARHLVPSARVMLSAKLERHLYYREGADASSLWLIDASNQSQAINAVRTAPDLKNAFEQVDTLQKCSRQVVISFNNPSPQDSADPLTLKNTKKLKDGRTAYIFQNNCPYGAEPLLRIIDQLESY